jgi:hypothetical protein
VSGAQLLITIQYQDRSGQPNAPYGTDETVTGTLTSYVNTYGASGGPSLNPPTYPTDLKISTNAYFPSGSDSGFSTVSGPV